MYVWRKFFAGLSSFLMVILPPALALYLIDRSGAFLDSSKALKLATPFWEESIFKIIGTGADFVSPHILSAAILFLFFLAIGPRDLNQRFRILWNAAWIFIVFNIALFLLEIADPFKMSAWPILVNFTLNLIKTVKNIFTFNIYVGWAASLAFVYSSAIYLKDLARTFGDFLSGLLDRRVKPILIDELKTALGLRLIRTSTDLIPITPGLLTLMILIFAIGALPLFLAPSFKDYSLTSVMNVLGAAILTYGFVQIFGVIFIFITGLVYYLIKNLSRPQKRPSRP